MCSLGTFVLIELAPYLFTFHIHVRQSYNTHSVDGASPLTYFIFVFRFSAEFAPYTKKNPLTHTRNHFVRFASLFRVSVSVALNHIINGIFHAYRE